MKNFCGLCLRPCEVIEIEDHQRLEHFGTPCTLTQYESASECCQSEVISEGEVFTALLDDIQKRKKDLSTGQPTLLHKKLWELLDAIEMYLDA